MLDQRGHHLMPKFTSEKQRGAFVAAASNPAVAKRLGIPQAVARRAMAEDRGGKLPARAPSAIARERAELLRRRGTQDTA